MPICYIKTNTMYNGDTISLKDIMWKVMNSPFLQDLTYESAAEKAMEAIKLIGAPLAYVNKVTSPPIKIEDHKGLVPSNIVIVRGARAYADAEAQDEIDAIPMTEATDIYHAKADCDLNDRDLGFEATYSIQSGVITTAFKEGFVELSYQAIATDDEGFPLIPKNQKFELAVEYYIRYRSLEPLWETGKVPDKVFTRVDQLKSWYIGAAQSGMQLKSMDHVEAMMNSINRLIINSPAQRNFFKFMGKHERIKKYR